MGDLDSFILANPRFVGVVDSDALLSSIDNDCRKGWTSRLARIGGAGTARLYAAEHVYAELYRGLERISACSGTSIDILRRRLEEEYLPILRFVEVATTEPRDVHVAAVVDEKDVPTAILAQLLAPCIVFSGDRHLRKPGFAPQDWRAVAQAGVAVVEGDQAMAGTSMLVVLPSGLAWAGLDALGRKLGVSTWLLVGVVVLVIVALLWKAERRDAVRRWIGPLAHDLMDVLARTQTEKTNGLRQVRAAMLQPTKCTMESAIARVLARAREPLLAREIHAELASLMAASEVPKVSKVRALLKANPAFVPSGNYRWQLGRRRGAIIDVTW